MWPWPSYNKKKNFNKNQVAKESRTLLSPFFTVQIKWRLWIPAPFTLTCTQGCGVVTQQTNIWSFVVTYFTLGKTAHHKLINITALPIDTGVRLPNLDLFRITEPLVCPNRMLYISVCSRQRFSKSISQIHRRALAMTKQYLKSTSLILITDNLWFERSKCKSLQVNVSLWNIVTIVIFIVTIVWQSFICQVVLSKLNVLHRGIFFLLPSQREKRQNYGLVVTWSNGQHPMNYSPEVLSVFFLIHDSSVWGRIK